jgi:mannose-1-phosphate guanylyltransferase/mannose-1-phosphate guanylyltransferase/mannose-6-phosphate isomerase
MFGPPIIVAAAQHADEIERQTAGRELRALILEPSARNTAPAIALAALLAPADSPMLVMPSDHLITNPLAFVGAVQKGMAAANEGSLVTFGIKPTRPETGYGYIRKGSPLAPHVFRVDSFLEKPDAPTAEQLVGGGDHFWNGGIFLLRPDAYLAALREHAPKVLEAAQQSLSARQGFDKRVHPEAGAFEASPSISIDYAVMEKSASVAVVPVDMGWSDVGSWDALYDISAKDAVGNSLSGDVVALGSQNCLIRSDGPAIVAIDVNDLVVIATGDAVLIVPRGESQRVKDGYDLLKARGHKTLD